MYITKHTYLYSWNQWESNNRDGPMGHKHLYNYMQVNTSTESSEQLVLPATEEEMMQYESHITATSQYSFSLSLPSLTFHIPGKHFLETLYNRFATDLALWQPATPASVERANATSMFYSSVDILQPAVPRNDKFRLCKSVLRGDPLLFILFVFLSFTFTMTSEKCS